LISFFAVHTGRANRGGKWGNFVEISFLLLFVFVSLAYWLFYWSFYSLLLWLLFF